MSESVAITTYSPSAITTHPTATAANTGDSFTLTCEATGVDPDDMEVTTFWTRNDKIVNGAYFTHIVQSTSKVF